MTNVKLGSAQMMRGKCRECDWVFDIVALPMPVTSAAAMGGAAHCPMCGAGPKKILVDLPRALTQAEAVHKANLLNRISEARS